MIFYPPLQQFRPKARGRRPGGLQPLDLLLACDLPLMPTTLFVLVNAGDQRLPADRPHRRMTRGGSGQRHRCRWFLHLRDRLQFWDSGYRR